MRLLFFLLVLFLTMGSLGSQYDVIIVRSDVPADWIIAQAYSHKSGILIVATSPTHLDSTVKTQLSGYRNFGFEDVIIIGGENAISREVQQELDDMGFVTHRISEANRHGTSATMAIKLFPDSKTAILVNGEALEALLVAGRLASSTGDPVLFVKRDSIPPSVSAALKTIGAEKILLVDYELSDEMKRSLASQGYDIEVIKSIEGFEVKRDMPTEYAYLILGIALGVFALFTTLRLRRLKERVPYTLLTGDEEKIVKVILENSGEITQDQLPEKTSFSRPKISRVISELVGRDILSKEPHGRTQKLVVKKEFYEKKK
ncbi:MAG: hypothetical protein V3T58_08265 [Candidatus Hydrothermarchaeales archaeon]